MTSASCHVGPTTVSGLPAEDVVVLASGTLWQVPPLLRLTGLVIIAGIGMMGVRCVTLFLGSGILMSIQKHRKLVQS